MVRVSGFNAGHSSFNFLTARRDVFLHSFDIGSFKCSRPIASYLQRKFPGRLSLTFGDSRNTVPRYFTRKRSSSPLTCDMISVDGGHTSDVPLRDILNFARVASLPHNVILIDDYNEPAVRKAWSFALKSGIVRQHKLFNCRFARHRTKQFVVGKVVQRKPNWRPITDWKKSERKLKIICKTTKALRCRQKMHKRQWFIKVVKCKKNSRA